MNPLELILKQLRQRALSTVLTVLSIALGVGLAIAVLVLRREGQGLFGQNDYGYEVLAGVKGSGLQLVANTVYHIDQSPGNIKYSVYEALTKERIFRQDVKSAVPQCVGDSYKGQPVVGTTAEFFGYDDDGRRIENAPGETPRRFEYRPGRSFEVDQGRPLDGRKFEAVLGSDAARLTGLGVGDRFRATHGFPQPGQTPDVHEETWTVVGTLRPTRTAADKVVWVGLTSFYTIFEHARTEIERAMLRRGENPATRPHDDDDDAKHYRLDAAGRIELDPEVLESRELSAVLVKARSAFGANNLIYNLNLQPDVMAVSPAVVMRDFFANFLDGPIKLLLVVSVLVTAVAAVGILTTVYNSVASRLREIAVLRALGATRRRVLLLVCAEAVTLGLLGGGLGFVLGHALCAAGSGYLRRTLGQGVAWARVGPDEAYYLAGVLALALAAGLVPALKAYRTPVADNLGNG